METFIIFIFEVVWSINLTLIFFLEASSFSNLFRDFFRLNLNFIDLII